MITSQTFVNVVGNFKREGGRYVPFVDVCVYITSHSQFALNKRDLP